MKKVKQIFNCLARDRWEIGFVEGGLNAVMEQETIKVNWMRHDLKDWWFADPFIMDVTDSAILGEWFRFIPCKALRSNHKTLDCGLHTLNTYKDVTVIDVNGWDKPLFVKTIKILKKLL